MLSISPKLSGGSIKGRLIVEVIDEHKMNMAVSK